MAKFTPTAEEVLELCKDVESSAGLEVTCTRDCEIVSAELSAHDGRFPVSVSTLRRLFGLIPNRNSFSLTTLNSLSRYVGYPSFKAWKIAHGERLASRGLSEEEADRPLGTSIPRHPNFKQSIHPSAWSTPESKYKIDLFLTKHKDPDHFVMTSREFKELKTAVFTLYQRGDFDVGLWLELEKRPHILRFVVEQFPPLDYLASFGRPMMESYLKQAENPSHELFGSSVLAAGFVAQDRSWSYVMETLPAIRSLNPGVHPYIQSRILGIRLLAFSEGQLPQEEGDLVKQLILEGFNHETELWPRWASQHCYFALNLADWAILSGDIDIVQAVQNNMETFQEKQDWYSRDEALDTILNLRQAWNEHFLGNGKHAKSLAESIPWENFFSMESRTLGMWYHALIERLALGNKKIAQGNFWHCANLTNYSGLARRISSLKVPS